MIYEKVADYCKKKNISIFEFEKTCGIGNGTVGKWKTDNSKPSLTTLEKMSAATGISISEWLLEREV